MLRYLKISNLAIIDEVEVEFRKGLNVLTGETGAGKSILIGALNLALGSRSSADMVRSGEDEAYVEALFELPEGFSLPPVVEDEGDPRELIISRRLLPSGRSRSFVGGRLVSSAVLQAVGQSLVSIFGQHEHHVLTNPEEHLDILDRFGALETLRENTAKAFDAWKKNQRGLRAAEVDLERQLRQGEKNEAAVAELSEAGLTLGEEERLFGERERMKNAFQIREKAFEAYNALYSRSGSLIEGFSDVRRAVEYLASVDPELVPVRDNLEEAVYRIEDIALILRRVSEKSYGDPRHLEIVEDRLALIRRLKKKYAADLEGLVALREGLTQESGKSFEAKSTVQKLRNQVDKLRGAYLNSARELSDARHTSADNLAASMKSELRELAMQHAQFDVVMSIVDEDKGDSLGLDSVEFFLASNPGEPPRPLARIASGGELSRIMLALKALQVDRQGAPTVIFDEVDSGIGGHTAFAVGSRLLRVAGRQQVLCVTHLHQVAALADHHLSVRKVVEGGRTRITVTPLDTEDRIGELARMLGASPDSESARHHVIRLMNGGIPGGTS